MVVVPWFSAQFVNDGGPLIVLPRELLGYWRGAFWPMGEIPPGAPSHGIMFGSKDNDFDRACSAREPVDVLAVGPGHGLVVGGTTCMADESEVRWLRLPGTPGAVLAVAVNCSHLEATCTHPELGDAIARSDAEDWVRLPQTMHVDGTELILMHAVENGRDPLHLVDEGMACIADAIACEVTPGTYVVEHCEMELPNDVEFRLIRLRLA